MKVVELVDVSSQDFESSKSEFVRRSYRRLKFGYYLEFFYKQDFRNFEKSEKFSRTETRPRYGLTRPDWNSLLRPPTGDDPDPDRFAVTTPTSLCRPSTEKLDGKLVSSSLSSAEIHPVNDADSGNLRPRNHLGFPPLLQIYRSMVVDHRITACRDRIKLGSFGLSDVSTLIPTPSGQNLTFRQL